MIENATDAALLKRFAERREESAFAELVERHGPIVQRVCRRFLRSEHDVEEVYQATFLVLALRASEVSWKSSVSGWLGDVARRLALHARSEVARRSRREVPASCLPGGAFAPVERLAAVFGDEIERQETQRLIGVAVDELPPKYRDPLVLCYLEGMTNNEAARRLGYPAGSISRRLDRARGLLRKQLAGQGVTLVLLVGVGLLAAMALSRSWSNRLPRELPVESVRAAMVLLEPESTDQLDLNELIAALKRNRDDASAVPDRPRLRKLGENAARAASAITAVDPGVDRDVWRAAVVEMKLAALELTRIKDDAPAPELLASLSRLNSTCVQCHATFH